MLNAKNDVLLASNLLHLERAANPSAAALVLQSIWCWVSRTVVQRSPFQSRKEASGLERAAGKNLVLVGIEAFRLTSVANVALLVTMERLIILAQRDVHLGCRIIGPTVRSSLDLFVPLSFDLILTFLLLHCR